MKTLRWLLAGKPDEEVTALALTRLAILLDLPRCYAYAGSYHFDLGHGWTLSIRPESGWRFRLASCEWGIERFTLWTAATDTGRLARLALQMRAEAVVRQEA